MPSLNKVFLIGYVGKDPEMRVTQNGTAVANFSMATTERGPGNEKRTEWHNIVAWQKTAEVVNQYVKKGDPLFVEGRLQTRTWDGKDGSKHSRTEIVAFNVQFLSTKEARSGAPVKEQDAPADPSDAPLPDGAPDDGLPF
jgi:single-strand DNA-binding protein